MVSVERRWLLSGDMGERRNQVTYLEGHLRCWFGRLTHTLMVVRRASCGLLEIQAQLLGYIVTPADGPSEAHNTGK